MPSTDSQTINLGGLLLAGLAAPASAFLIWTALDAALDGFPPGDVVGSLVGILMILILVTSWGFLPAAGFGAMFLLVLLKITGRVRPLGQLLIAGVAAAGAYVTAGYWLARAGQEWVFYVAPWAVDAVASGGHIGPGRFWTIVLSIVASGGVAALVYEKVAAQGFRQA